MKPMNPFSLFWVAAELAITSGSTQVFAGPNRVDVEGRRYSATSCHYYSQTKGDFRLKYTPPTEWGAVQVALHYAFHDSYHDRLYPESTIGLDRGSSLVFEINDVVVDGRGSFYDDYFTFYFTVKLPDGTVRIDTGWDEAGSSALYARIDKLPYDCDAGPYKAMIVTDK